LEQSVAERQKKKSFDVYFPSSNKEKKKDVFWLNQLKTQRRGEGRIVLFLFLLSILYEKTRDRRRIFLEIDFY